MPAAGSLLCLLSAALATSAFSVGGHDNSGASRFSELLPGVYVLVHSCDLLQPPVVSALAELMQWAGGGGEAAAAGAAAAAAAGAGAWPCSDALRQVHDIRVRDCPRFSRLLADMVSSCPADRLHGTEWNSTTVDTRDWSLHSLPQLEHAFRRMMEATWKFMPCRRFYVRNVTLVYDDRDLPAVFPTLLQRYREYLRNATQLLSLAVPVISELLVPLAAKHLGNHTNDQQLHGWTEKLKHLRDMVHTHFLGFLDDVQLLQEQLQNCKIEEDKNNIGKYIIRVPLAYDMQLYRPPYMSFWDDFGDVCEEQLPNASLVFRLQHALYSFYTQYWPPMGLESFSHYSVSVKGEEWQLEDQSNETLSVDTECLQLLVDALEHPRCPLEELPPEATRRRRDCRRQLREDLLHRAIHIPVTSYLAYTQRARVSLCLLAWMVSNSHGICQDVPFTTSQSMHDADCYIRTPDDISCPKSNDTDAICYVSRAIMSLKCRDFYTEKPTNFCSIYYLQNGSYTPPLRRNDISENRVDTGRTTVYKRSATLKYKNFKIDNLRSLEISFVALNILFRTLTAGVFAYLPRLRNLPGKLLLCFQVTGLAQILCSEVAHRMAGALPLRAAVLVDSGLTLLSCLWLNTFCYQMYACVRHLRLPNDLLPCEASKIFRRQVVYVLIPCSVVCAVCSALENTREYYLFYSRVIFVVGISLSVTFNLVCLGLLAYMYFHARKSMQQLSIYSYDKSISKKDVIFMSVKTVILSGIGIIIRMGFHQAQDIAQSVYYVHIATMLQGPVLFVLFVCNGTTLPVLRHRVLGWLNPDSMSPDLELFSAAERNLKRRANDRCQFAESTV